MSLKVSREGRVLRLTLARTDKRNALSPDLCESLVAHLKDDPSVGAILLDAEGEVFCAGMDLDNANVSATMIHEELFTFGARLNTPVIAAVQGPALGGGLGLVANAHIAISAQGAQFGLTEIRVGMWPYVIWRSVTAALSQRRATMLALTGRVFGSSDALQWGLIHEVVPPIELEDRAMAIAQAVAESSPEAIRRGLTLARETRDLSVTDAGRRALQLREESFVSADFAEGIAAFREKRRPRWPSIG